MNCPHCHQPIEPGAAFCGNCGQPLVTNAIAEAVVPSYAVATTIQQSGEKPAWLAVLFGVTGIAGALFFALLGLTLGLAGIIMGTMSRSGAQRKLSTTGLVLSSLAVAANLGVWAFAVQHDPRFNQTAAQTNTHKVSSTSVVASNLTTPCYTAEFVNKLNISNVTGNCDMAAFNGATISASTDAYKVYADTSPSVTPANFSGIVKAAIEKDLHSSLPSFTIDSEKVTQFAASPAYAVIGSDKAQHVTVLEAAVLHRVKAGDNIFILVHAVNGNSADLNHLEAGWQWQ
jgi:hypothetical protein